MTAHTNQPETLKSGYSRSKAHYTFTPLTLQNWNRRPANAQLMAIDRNGALRNVKLTSAKTWKRRSDIEIHWKYGLYEYGYTTITEDGQKDGPRLGWAELTNE